MSLSESARESSVSAIEQRVLPCVTALAGWLVGWDEQADLTTFDHKTEIKMNLRLPLHFFFNRRRSPKRKFSRAFERDGWLSLLL